MASSYFRCLWQAARLSLSVLISPPLETFPQRLISCSPFMTWRTSSLRHLPNPLKPSMLCRNFSHGTVNLVISEGKPKFEVHEGDLAKKGGWKTKKKLKMQRMREKQRRKAANRRDPGHLTVKRKKQKFANVEERIKYKLEKAKIKEELLVERLKKYEVPKVQGPIVKPHDLTGEERFYFKKMAQKRSNYVPVGKRGVFGGVILNMHMHWKKHETVKVFFKPFKPGEIHGYVQEIERLSGGIAIQTIGDDTAIFYRGKNYVQPEVMSPIDTLSKKRALEKSKYEQSLEAVRHFITVAEKELELYHRHLALYSNQNNQCRDALAQSSRKDATESVNGCFGESETLESITDCDRISGMYYDPTDEELSGSQTDSSNELQQDEYSMPDDQDQNSKEQRSLFQMEQNS